MLQGAQGRSGPGDAYRGADRRRESTASAPAAERSWLVGGLVLCALVGSLAWFISDGDLATLKLGARSAGFVAAIGVGVVAMLYGRVSGEAAGNLTSVVGWLIAAILAIELLQPERSAAVTALCSVLGICAAVWLARAFLAPEVDASNGLRRELTIAACAIAAAFVPLWIAAPWIDRTFSSAHAASHLGVALAWAIVAVIGLTVALRGASVLRGWTTWMAVAWMLSEVARALGAGQGDVWLALSAGLRVSGLFIAGIGATYGLSHHALARRDDLHHEALRLRDQDRRRGLLEQERAHEVRTALMAVEGAALTLQRHGDRLTPEQRERLSDAVRAGVAHLRDLAAAEHTRSEQQPLLQIIEDRAELARRRGLQITVSSDEVARSSVCERRALSQVLDNLLTNASLHAQPDVASAVAGAGAGVAVDIEVAATPRTVTVRVADDGPGIPDDEHERIFGRGERLHLERAGEGLGLDVSRRLLRELGGDLRSVPGTRGACFEISLPLRQRAGSDPDVVDDRSEVTEVLDAAVALSTDRAPAPGGARLVEDDGDLGGDLRSGRCHDGKVVHHFRRRFLKDDGDVRHIGEQAP